MVLGRNGRADLPRGSTGRSPPLSRTVFSPGRPLTGHNWAAPLLLIDRTPFRRLLILALLLISGNIHPNPGPISNHPHPRYPCSICHLDVGRDSLQCSACLKWVHVLCSSLTHADFRTIFATGTAVGWRCPACHPQRKTGSPTHTSLLVMSPASPPPPSPGFPPLPPGFYQSRPPRGPPRYPCSICSLKVGKNSLKCSTCSKWMHFSCSSLTRADFRKICTAGSPMGWNCPACLNGDLASPTYQQVSPRPVSPPPPPPPTVTCSDLMDSSLPLPSHPPLLNTYPPSAFTLPVSPPPPTSSQPIHNSPPHPQRNPHLSHNLRILQWNAGGLSSFRRAELIAFLSGNQYDLIFLQETHLLSTKKFQIPDYYTLRTDWTFGRQSPVFSGTHNTGGGVLTLIHSDLAFSPVSVSSLSSQDPYSDYTCVKVLLSNHSPLQFLNLYYPPIRNTPSDSRTRTFYPDILPNSPDTFILGDFNVHHPTWDRLIPPNPLGNDLFRRITSSGLEILNDPESPTLLHHTTRSRSSPDISLAPASLVPHCEWRTLPGLGYDHLPIEIVLPLSPVRHPNTRPPKFNYNKASWDVYQSYIVEHLPSLDVDALNIHQAARSFSLFLLEAAKASIPFGRLGRSPKAWWSQEAESAVRERRKARSVAHPFESQRLRYIDASRRASSVISRAKSATWQATCSNLSPRSDPRAVFRLLNAISGKKNTSQDPSFPDCTSTLDTANHYASYLRSHLSQATPRSSRRAERQFMNELRKAICEDASSLHNSFSSPFSLTELSTAICILSSSTASGLDQIAYPLLKHLPEPAQLLLFSLFNRSWLSHTSHSCWKPTTIIPIHKPGKPTSSPSSFRPISLTSGISKLFERLILSRLTFHLESNHLLSTCQAGFRPGRSPLDQILTLSQSINLGWLLKEKTSKPNHFCIC